jgi:hypothetical protein
MGRWLAGQSDVVGSLAGGCASRMQLSYARDYRRRKLICPRCRYSVRGSSRWEADGSRRGIEVAVEIELQNDRGCAERARRRRVRETGDLRELALWRLRHGCRHGFGACSRKLRGDLDGWEIDLRQRRHRQERKGRNAGKRQRHRQQRGRDGAADEWSGDVMRSNRALVRNLPEN